MSRRPEQSLRRKLGSSFTALGLLGLAVIGVNSYTVVQWRESEDEQARHYTRSLRLLEARALTFEAFKEVPDAVLGGDADAQEDYERRLAPIDAVFAEWAGLAEDAAERRQVEQVQDAADALDEAAEAIFALVDQGRVDEAVVALEQVEEQAFEPFDELSSQAVDSDRAKREEVTEAAADARRTATIALVVAALGVVSLLLLVAAFLGGGVFRPVRALHRAMGELSAGHTDIRLPEDGDDEISSLNRDFNVLAQTIAHQRSGGAAARGELERDEARQALGRLVDAVRLDAERLRSELDGPQHGLADSVLVRVAGLQSALDRIGSLAFPVGLHLTDVDCSLLMHDVLSRVGDEVVRRAVSIRVDVPARPVTVHADRVRLRETLSELVRNALDALPERGGSLALRVGHEGEETVRLEVADDGPGFAVDDVGWLLDEDAHREVARGDERGVGLRLATSVVEQHGGRLEIETPDEGGTIARILLPLRTPGGSR